MPALSCNQKMLAVFLNNAKCSSLCHLTLHRIHLMQNIARFTRSDKQPAKGDTWLVQLRDMFESKLFMFSAFLTNSSNTIKHNFTKKLKKNKN